MIKYCPICGSSKIEARTKYRASHIIFSECWLANCLSCEMVFATPMPSEKALAEYNANYFLEAHGGESSNKCSQGFFSGIARLRMAYIERYINKCQVSVKKILEIGPGSGFFARNWLEKYPETNYIAFETDVNCFTSLKKIGINVINNLEEIKKESVVDLIVISHVLEHVINPLEFLRNVTAYLRQGGILFIEVPCRDFQYKSIDEPHLLFFDKKSMTCLLEYFSFKHIQLTYHGESLTKLSSLYYVSLRNKFLGIRARLINFGLTAFLSRKRSGMEHLVCSLERASIAPFKAHLESAMPAQWLRAIVTKSV